MYPSTTFLGIGPTLVVSILSLWFGLPPGQHKVMIELANSVHQVFTGCACTATVTFTVPDAAMSHEGSSHN